MLGTGTTRSHPDSPERADDLAGYLRRGPRELPPGIPGARSTRAGRPGKPLVPALACVTALAALLVGCQIVKQAGHPGASATPSTGRTPGLGGPLPALPATSGALSVQVTSRVFAERTVHIRVVVTTPRANTLRQTLTGTVSVAPDGTLTGTATATADRANGVHVRAPAIFLPGRIFLAPPAKLMPTGKTWAQITPSVPNGRASYAAREAAYVLYASATSWSLLRYAKDTSRPRWSGTGIGARAQMAGTVVLATALPHTSPGMHDAVITFAGPGTKTATWQVTLDSRLLPVKCVITAVSPVIGPITAVVTYSDWGAPVHAVAPATATIATYAELPPYLRQVSQ
jgi:hypothetical protein